MTILLPSSSLPNTRKMVSVASGVAFPYGNVLSSAGATAVTIRKVHIVTATSYDLRLVYTNAYGQTGNHNDSPTPNQIVIKATLEDSNGNIYNTTFGGATSITIDPGATVMTDPIGINCNKGDTIYTRTYVSLPSAISATGQYPAGTQKVVNGEWVYQGDYTTVASPSGATSGTWGVAPTAILGYTSTPQPCIALVGDSITFGSGDGGTSTSTVGSNFGGWAVRALNNNYPFINFANGGETSWGFINGKGSQIRAPLLDYCTHAIVLYGTNDCIYGNSDSSNVLNNSSKLLSSLQKVWTSLANRGIKVYAATIPPLQCSSSSYLNYLSTRAYVNDVIRSAPTPLSGYIDTAAALETSINSGVWKGSTYNATNHTWSGSTYRSGDDVHPSTTGHAAMASAVNTNVFTV